MLTQQPLPDSNPLPDAPLEQLKMKIAELEKSILAGDSLLPVHLQTIHGHMLKYAESPLLLSDDELRVILAAQQSFKKISLAAIAEGKGPKKSTSGTAKLKEVAKDASNFD